MYLQSLNRMLFSTLEMKSYSEPPQKTGKILTKRRAPLPGRAAPKAVDTTVTSLWQSDPAALQPRPQCSNTHLYKWYQHELFSFFNQRHFLTF